MLTQLPSPQLPAPPPPDTEKQLQEFHSCPLFMTETPSSNTENPAIQALQSLIYDDEPMEIAQNFKNQGNAWYIQSKTSNKHHALRQSLEYYTKAIDVNVDDAVFNSIVYCNRGLVQMELENYGKAIKDFIYSSSLNANVKSVYRHGKCLFLLGRYEDAIKVLEGDDDVKEIVELRKECLVKMNEIESKRLVRLEKEERERKEFDDLLDVIHKRNITLKSSDKTNPLPPYTTPFSPHPLQVHISTTGSLIWPVLFLYPEHSESDLIVEFDEDDTILTHLSIMFDEKPGWDVQGKYTLDRIRVYFIGGDEKCFRVNQGMRLGDVLGCRQFVVMDGVPRFFVVEEGYDREWRRSVLRK